MFARTLIVATIVAATGSGCVASTIAPEGWRRDDKDVQRLALGSWTRIETRAPARGSADGSGPAFDGELIAADDQSVMLAREANVIVVPTACISRMTIAAFQPGIAETVVAGSLGTLSTLSHGFFLVLSAPVWLVTTAGTTWAQSASGTFEDPRLPALWARFPQGVPPGFLEQPDRIVSSVSNCRRAPRVPASPPRVAP